MIGATAAGSMPGRDFAAALRAVEPLEETPWPELPALGAGSAMVGRAAAMLQGLPVVLDRDGWRLAARPDLAARRARQTLVDELDQLEEALAGEERDFKVAVCGPVTLAAELGRRRGEAAHFDPGARRDVAASLAEGVAALMREVARRLPGVQTRLQLDEPALPVALAGGMPAASGLRTGPALSQEEVAASWGGFGADAVVHCCGRGDWLRVARGMGGVHVDAGVLCVADFDELAGLAESGARIVLGVLDAAQADVLPSLDELVDRSARLAARVGAAQVSLAPSCGLAPWRPDAAAEALRRLARAASLVGERLSR